jgi:hypothetical protein
MDARYPSLTDHAQMPFLGLLAREFADAGVGRIGALAIGAWMACHDPKSGSWA